MSNQKVKPNETPVEFLIHPRTISEGFTQSEFSDMSCMQRWNYRYNQLLYKPGIINFPFKVGSGFHDGMEQFYATSGKRVNIATLQFDEYDIPSLADNDALDYWNAILPVMMEAYQIYYIEDAIKWRILQIEREVDLLFEDLRFRGKIDLTLENKNGFWIADHKSSSKLNKWTVAGWDFRFQFMFYIWIMSKIETKLKLKGYIVNLVKKTELRIKKTESLPEFAQRVRQDMIAEPDKYFYRESYIISKDALLHFEKSVLGPKVTKLKYIIENPNHPLAKALMEEKNTDECQKYGGKPCDFIDICRHGSQMLSLYRTKPQKHLELGSIEEE